MAGSPKKRAKREAQAARAVEAAPVNPWMTLDEAAVLAGVSAATVRRRLVTLPEAAKRHVRSGEVPGLKCGTKGAVLILRATALAMVEPGKAASCTADANCKAEVAVDQPNATPTAAVTPRIGRPTLELPPYALIEELCGTSVVTRAGVADVCGVSLDTLDSRIADDPELAAVVARCIRRTIGVIETALVSRAKDCSDGPGVTAAKTLLEKRGGEDWKPAKTTQELTGPGGGPVQVEGVVVALQGVVSEVVARVKAMQPRPAVVEPDVIDVTEAPQEAP